MTHYGKIKSYDSAKGAGMITPDKGGDALAFNKSDLQQQAQEPAGGLGLAVSADRKPYRDFDDKLQPLPLLTYENRWIHIAGPGVDVKLPSLGPVGLRLRSRFGFDGYDAHDSPRLAGKRERKGSRWQERHEGHPGQ